jgi:BMFP domain-containing protein YqiC
MQTRNKILDDLSQLMTNAMGVAQGARGEAETAMKGWIDRWLADRDFVTREEFEAVRAMAQKAREENAALKARIDALHGATSLDGTPQADQATGSEPAADVAAAP